MLLCAMQVLGEACISSLDRAAVLCSEEEEDWRTAQERGRTDYVDCGCWRAVEMEACSDALGICLALHHHIGSVDVWQLVGQLSC